jgi:hypothetical protein
MGLDGAEKKKRDVVLSRNVGPGMWLPRPTTSRSAHARVFVNGNQLPCLRDEEALLFCNSRQGALHICCQPKLRAEIEVARQLVPRASNQQPTSRQASNFTRSSIHAGSTRCNTGQGPMLFALALQLHEEHNGNGYVTWCSIARRDPIASPPCVSSVQRC